MTRSRSRHSPSMTWHDLWAGRRAGRRPARSLHRCRRLRGALSIERRHRPFRLVHGGTSNAEGEDEHVVMAPLGGVGGGSGGGSDGWSGGGSGGGSGGSSGSGSGGPGDSSSPSTLEWTRGIPTSSCVEQREVESILWARHEMATTAVPLAHVEPRRAEWMMLPPMPWPSAGHSGSRRREASPVLEASRWWRRRRGG